jgi:hypothetical protein
MERAIRLGADSVPRPVARRVWKIEPARKCHRQDFCAKFSSQLPRKDRQGFEIAIPAVQQKKAGLASVWTAHDTRLIFGFSDEDTNVPSHAETFDLKKVFMFDEREVRHVRNPTIHVEDFLARIKVLDGFVLPRRLHIASHITSLFV